MSSKSNSLHYNGRSTSQISIYDYPEHLNPFYEAENHKRIRFWKIGKNKTNNNNNNGLNRRGSFSLNGLKEMWAFKSFRPKKQSSTTCINKTSESPPPLRRDLQSDNYGTYDPRIRHTIQNDSFQRNVPYRASLQDVSRSSTTTTNEYQNGFGNSFGRNQQYRSTIQTPHRMKRYDNSISNSSTPQNLTPLHRRYVYGGSVTPQPTIRNNNNKSYNYKFDDSTTTNFSRGSSQLSVATNPFEDDDDDIVMGHSINSASSTTSLNSRPARKKRRAPQPPSSNSPVSKAIEEESTSQKFQNNENNDILNLTAEIETFVKNSDNDISSKNNNTKELIITEEPNISNNDSQKIKNNENLTETTIIIQKRIHNSEENYPKATPRSSKRTEKNKTNVQQISPKIIITETENSKNNEKLDHNKNLPSKTEVITEKTEKIVNQSNINNIELEINDNVDSMKVKENWRSDSNQYSQTNGYINSEIKIDHQQTNTEKDKIENSNYQNNNNNKLENNNNDTKKVNIVNPTTTNIEITDKLTISTNELKITESEEDISNLPTIENENEFGKYQIRYVPLKDNSPTIQRRNSRSTSPPPDNYDLPPVPMARRRSVREIIESINRSQSLLKPHSKDIINSNNNNNYNYEIKENNLNKTTTIEKEFYENNEEIKINNKEIIKQSSPTLSVEQNDNNIIFEKCTTFINNNNSRESSPTTSNLDWNPLPKPKRTSKLSAELMITEN